MIGPIIIGAVTAALALMGYLFATAPVGFEDSTGFHLGEPPMHTDFDGDQ